MRRYRQRQREHRKATRQARAFIDETMGRIVTNDTSADPESASKSEQSEAKDAPQPERSEEQHGNDAKHDDEGGELTE